jgi:hypothetical protein
MPVGRRLDILAEYPALHLVRLDGAFDPARQVDLYLPDDTHWSSVGHRLAARAVERRLVALGVLGSVSPTGALSSADGPEGRIGDDPRSGALLQ